LESLRDEVACSAIASMAASQGQDDSPRGLTAFWLR